MKPLKMAQRVFVWLSICPCDAKNEWKRMFYIIFSLTVGGMLFAQLVTSGLYFMEFHSEDLESSLYAIYQIFAWMPILYIYVGAFMSRHRIRNVLTGMEEIYDKSKHFFFWDF